MHKSFKTLRHLLPVLLITWLVSGCSAGLIEKNLNCFAGLLTSTINTIANSVNLTVQRVRSCKKLKDSKEGGGIASLSHKNVLFVARIRPIAVTPGHKLQSIICYEVKSVSNKINVIETRKLLLPDGNEITISEDNVSREHGVWESKLEVQIPYDVAPGSYKLIHKIRYEDVNLEHKNPFSVVNSDKLKTQCQT